MIQLWRRYDDIRRNPAASGNLAAAVRELNFRGVLGNFAFVMILIKRDGLVVALNEPPAGRVVTRRSQRKAGVFAERLNGLHQALAKRRLANNQTAIMVLHRA